MDAQPGIRALGVTPAAHCLYHLASLRHRLFTVLLDPEMGGTVNLEIGDGHCVRIAR
jgi:hypothetical protein